ncbi:hypothetical protein BDQ17DRAFT_1336679 [Cyathus striatus]|nr:hypothetical protein BDQ17DRAFT_1336679 [Cyathus striatus]
MSVVHIILDPNAEFGYHKSHDCLIHVWSFGSSIGGQNLSDTDTNLNLSESVPGNRLLILGSLFATLLSTDRKGQILELIPFSYPSLNSEDLLKFFGSGHRNLLALFETEYFHTQLPIIQPLLNHWKMGITHATSVELQLNPRTDNTI